MKRGEQTLFSFFQSSWENVLFFTTKYVLQVFFVDALYQIEEILFDSNFDEYVLNCVQCFFCIF